MVQRANQYPFLGSGTPERIQRAAIRAGELAATGTPEGHEGLGGQVAEYITERDLTIAATDYEALMAAKYGSSANMPQRA